MVLGLDGIDDSDATAVAELRPEQGYGYTKLQLEIDLRSRGK